MWRYPRDNIDLEGASVQAVAIFYLVTDLLNLDGSTEDHDDGGAPKSFVKAFAPDAKDKERWQLSCSSQGWQLRLGYYDIGYSSLWR